jgi:hypothetical protein
MYVACLGMVAKDSEASEASERGSGRACVCPRMNMGCCSVLVFLLRARAGLCR